MNKRNFLTISSSILLCSLLSACPKQGAKTPAASNKSKIIWKNDSSFIIPNLKQLTYTDKGTTYTISFSSANEATVLNNIAGICTSTHPCKAYLPDSNTLYFSIYATGTATEPNRLTIDVNPATTVASQSISISYLKGRSLEEFYPLMFRLRVVLDSFSNDEYYLDL